MTNDEDALQSPRRRKRKKKKHKNLFDITGVKKIFLSELTQKIVECIVGEHVTSESPWKYVKRELVQDNLELHEESSEFLPIRREVMAFPRPEMLIGYIADETQDKDDEFYICVTEEATDTVEKIREKLQIEQQLRLSYQLFKPINSWQSMGTEVEVDDFLIRNNRPLLQVEVESQYPIFPSKVEFRLVTAESRNDGYMELRCSPEENLVSVYMKRIDNAVQVAPALMSSEAQTTCTYPKNATTQYFYELGSTSHLLVECQPNIIRYVNDHMEDLSDILKVNGTINLYANDFQLLTSNTEMVSTDSWAEFTNKITERLSFMDVNLCKGKMVSDLYWHHMWSGILAVSYCVSANNMFLVGPNKVDEVDNAIHNLNVVLIWSFDDPLKPKLILEAPREIDKIAFCKFDENILIGGCRNGQIVIWDIRNKLQKVEEKEILTTAQQKYRTFLHSMMGWMKNTHNIAVVRPAAVSDLRHSHKNRVTAISWIDPHHEFSRTGNLSKLPQDADNPNYSFEFITTSLDGTVLIWDLTDKPTFQRGGYKPKKLKRLLKKPSALQVDESPYRVLHLNLKPRYKINVTRPNDKNKLVGLSRSAGSYCHIKYVERNPGQSKKPSYKERVYYDPVMDSITEVQPLIRIGTVDGDYAEIKWDGQDFDSGEIVNSELGKYSFCAKYHDGPITSITNSVSLNLTLTVGGKIFALWRSTALQKPILWRRNRHFYTKGEMNLKEPFRIIIHSSTGVLQRWIFPLNSKHPILSQVMSNGCLTASSTRPHSKPQLIYALADEQGSCRLFDINPTNPECSAQMTHCMKMYISKETYRKKKFLQWQDEFNKRNASYLESKKIEEERKAKEEAEKDIVVEKKISEDKAIKTGPQPGKFAEWVVEQRQLKEQTRIKAMIINKKQLDTKELEKRRKPLQKLDEENERKKRKQKERLKQGENIFKETVACLFPEVVREKPIPPPDPYAGGDIEEHKQICYDEYTKLSLDMDQFIARHPFEYDFNFKHLLKNSRGKREALTVPHVHLRRYDMDNKRLHTSLKTDHTDDEKLDEERGVTKQPRGTTLSAKILEIGEIM